MQLLFYKLKFLCNEHFYAQKKISTQNKVSNLRKSSKVQNALPLQPAPQIFIGVLLQNESPQINLTHLINPPIHQETIYVLEV